MEAIGLYIHIPFCVQKCPYCDFYSLSAPAAAQHADAYTAALLREMALWKDKGLAVDTVYLGGGTPSLLGADNLVCLLEGIGRCFRLEPDAEISMEANPGLIDGDTLQILRRAGINRLSLGAQSAIDKELAGLGRLHRHHHTETAVALAQAAGFASLSLDVMLGIPGQTMNSALATIDAFAALGVQHISAYLLKIEPGTPFAAQNVTAAGEEKSARLYLAAVDRLTSLGFTQYEISNFAQEGHPCRHNLHYWRCEPYLGLGCAAHSFWEGRRFYTPGDLPLYIGGENVYVEDGPGGGFAENVMLRLRLCEGIAFPPPFGTAGEISRLEERAVALAAKAPGLLHADKAGIRLKPAGMLVSNEIIRQLLA